MYGWMDEWFDGWVPVCMYVCMYACMNAWIDGYLYVPQCLCLCVSVGWCGASAGYPEFCRFRVLSKVPLRVSYLEAHGTSQEPPTVGALERSPLKGVEGNMWAT